MISENGFSDQFSYRIFSNTRSYLLKIKRVIFTGYWEASARCSLLESLFNVYKSLLYVLDNVNNTSRRTAACRLIA